MKMIRALIIDNEPLAVKQLSELIQKHYPVIQVIGQTGNMSDALEMTEKYAPELIFLDLQTGASGNSFEYLEKIKHLDPGIVVTASHAQHAVQAINTAQPWAFLMKPVQAEALNQAMHTSREKISDKSYIKYYQNKRLTIPDQKNGAHIIAASDILMIKGDSKLSQIVVLTGNKIERKYTYKSLREFEEELPRQFFFRTHGSFIVNLLKVKTIRYINRGGVAVLPFDQHASVAVSRLEGFLTRIQEMSAPEKSHRPAAYRSRPADG